jgi:hypothetical protein
VGEHPLLESRFETERITSDELTGMIRILHRKEFLGTGESGIGIWNISASMSLLPKGEEREEEVEI